MTNKSLYRAADRLEILQRIGRLREDAPAQWGKMDAAQMLAHCQVALRVALGELELKRVLIGVLFGRLAKKSLMRAEPFRRNLPTGREFIVADRRDFRRERGQLVALIERFAAAGPDGLAKGPHPFFGQLTTEEWETLMWKHLDHHLRQFEAA